jgi:hypothetical protein
MNEKVAVFEAVATHGEECSEGENAECGRSAPPIVGEIDGEDQKRYRGRDDLDAPAPRSAEVSGRHDG